jgi:glutaredoxin
MLLHLVLGRELRDNMITVYGKDNCSYCTKAKELLNIKQIPYSYLKVGEDIGINEFVEMYPNIKSVPYILVNKTPIGGFTDLQKYIEETASGFADNF